MSDVIEQQDIETDLSMKSPTKSFREQLWLELLQETLVWFQ